MPRTSGALIVYRPRPGAIPEGELNALADVYRTVLFESGARKEGGPAAAPDDATKGFLISEKEKGGRHVEH